MLETDWSLEMLSESLRRIAGTSTAMTTCRYTATVARKDMVLWVSALHLLAIVIAAMRSHFEAHTLSFMPNPSP